MSTHHLLYVSEAARAMTREDLNSILEVSRRHNAQEGITGILLWADGAFIQVLEGDQDKVRTLAERISGDSRHRNFMILSEHTAPSRVFADWAMGFKELDGDDRDGQLFRTTHQALVSRIAPSDGGLMLDMVLAFAPDFIEGRDRGTR